MNNERNGKKKINTQIIKLDGRNDKSDLEKIKRAADLLIDGKLVAFPTETVYGLGADALNESAVEKIYTAKGRPSDNPLIVHLADKIEIEKYADITEIAKKIIDFFMPAPLTVVLKKKAIIKNIITGGRDTVAIRVPKDKTARKLIELAGTPIAAPSANLSGKPSPTSAEHVIADMDGRVDAVLCGDDCDIGLESTVIAFDESGRVCILRSGAVTREMLEKVVGVENIAQAGNHVRECEAPKSPGMKYTHYSPDAPLYILKGGDSDIIEFISNIKDTKNTQKIGFLCYNEIAAACRSYIAGCENLKIIELGEKHNPENQAKNLFRALNKFNEMGVDVIYATEPSKSGIGEAICNRLDKASGGKFIDLHTRYAVKQT